MILHFPIVLLYLTLLIEIARLLGGARQEAFFQRAGFWTLSLSLLAIVAAAAAGVISEQFVKWTPQMAALLAAHQRDAALTGVFALTAWVMRILTRFPSNARTRTSSQWSVLGGRGRATILSTVMVVAAVIMISITGSLGGTMVYHYGAGTPLTQKTP